MVNLQSDIPDELYKKFVMKVTERKGEYRGNKDEALREAIRQYTNRQREESLLPPDLRGAIEVWCKRTGIKYENAIPLLVQIGFKARELLEVPPEGREDTVDGLIEFMKEEGMRGDENG